MTQGWLWSRLYHDHGSAGPSGPALGHFRLVAETGTPGEGFKLFEHVRGAHLSGTAPPRAAVTLALRLRTPDGPDRPYLATATADGAGRFDYTVPYATDPNPQAAYAAEARLHCPGGDVLVQIPEPAVLFGGPLAAACPR
jgi:hypothetical protein